MDRRLFFAMIGVFLLLTAGNALAEEDMKIIVEPDHVKVGLFYGGREIHVRTDMPAAHDVVIKVSGINKDLELKKKGKKGGVLWMNVGDLSYHDVPSLFIIKSSRPLKKLSSKGKLKQMGIGYDALEAGITSGEEDKGSFFGELIKLKEKEGIFSVDEKGVELRSLESGRQEANVTLFMPPKAPRGEYQVEVFGFKEGQGSLLGSRTIKLDFTSTTAFISNLANNHGLLYGCLASAIAIIAGLITGFIFGGKVEAH